MSVGYRILGTCNLHISLSNTLSQGTYSYQISKYLNSRGLNVYDVEFSDFNQSYQTFSFTMLDDKNATAAQIQIAVQKSLAAMPDSVFGFPGSKKVFVDVRVSKADSSIYEVKGTNNNNSANNIYIVKKGDTLSKIASRFNTNTAYLASINNGINTDRIHIGQAINVSGADVNNQNTGNNNTDNTNKNNTNKNNTNAPNDDKNKKNDDKTFNLPSLIGGVSGTTIVILAIGIFILTHKSEED